MSNADFYEIRTVWIKNSSEFFRVINNSKVVDYQLCCNSSNGMFKLIVVMEM